MLYLERFHDIGTTYVIVDAREFRRSQQAPAASLERVPRFEARGILEKIVRREPRLCARLYEALTGMLPPATGTFRLGTVANPEALLARMLGAFGGAQLASEPGGVDFARFHLLRERRGDRPVGTSPQTPESQRIEKALTAFGRAPFFHRGETYYLQRRGGVDGPLPNRDVLETLSESQLFAVLGTLSSESGLDPIRVAAAPELLAAAEAQRARTSTTELLLLRRQRVYIRPVEEAAPVTPSQLRRTLHFVAVEVVDESERPMPGVSVEVELSDGDIKQGVSGDDGMVRIEPAPPGNAIIRLRAIDGNDWRPAGGGARPAGQGAARSYTVKQGDTLARIARRFGQRSWKRVWDAAENEGLRKKRKSPHLLYPGDVVSVPGIALNECEKPVDQVHRLIVKPDAKVTLRLNLLGKKRAPLDGTTCKILAGDELLFEGPANDGKLECEIPLSVTEARLLVSMDGWEFERPLHIGGLDPNDEISGVQARLSNLGWFSGRPDGTSSEALMLAQNTFRDEQELAPADTLDDVLFSELEKAHLV